MRICFLADIRSVHTRRWIDFFSSSHEIHLITLEFSPGEIGFGTCDDYVRAGVRIYTLPRSLPGVLFNTLRIRKILRTIQPDLVHAHFVTHYGYWGARAGFHPLVISGWGDDVLIHARKFGLSFLVKYALRSADLITCDGMNTFRAIRDLGNPEEKIRLITHGVDTKKFSPENRDPEFFRALFQNTWPVVAYIRGFEPVYDPETVIRAISLTLKSIPEVNFVIGGIGGDHEKQVRMLADQLGIAKSIRFCGWIPHEELPRLLASSDIYLSVSLSEGGVAVSTFEAMASGIPVVVTDVGDNRQWIRDQINGFVVPVQNPKTVAEKIICLVKDPALRDTCGRQNRVLAAEKQDYYKEMEKVNILYKDLVKEVSG